MFYGEKLRFLREEKDISQYELSKILNLNKRVYGQYEREYVVIPLKHLNTICNYFNVSLDYIFNLVKENKYENIKLEIDKKITGERLKKFRIENNLTQEDLAKLLNTNKSVICGYEKGRYLIATPFLYTICKKYNISADYLMGRIDNPIYLKN